MKLPMRSVTDIHEAYRIRIRDFHIYQTGIENYLFQRVNEKFSILLPMKSVTSATSPTLVRKSNNPPSSGGKWCNKYSLKCKVYEC